MKTLGDPGNKMNVIDKRVREQIRSQPTCWPAGGRQLVNALRGSDLLPLPIIIIIRAYPPLPPPPFSPGLIPQLYDRYH